ncbi:histidine acid phosphatase [Cryptosporidium muris RN66]|uniref:Histidine acid phosphatase family protein n=1 Tax=Cryptosporidium muris (strain RN66) TaxID=441375 RepID=B6AC91_CRYMR|nr:histidine acid phosphatase [Cryptosporidium muris RN66]EEA06147.1 histidine acid phosphatase family protein [Cryptosporidium muris RN66]|eukprot:XP_002140496.1 histidine acid phosphatase [Cryptosporidium muris RN66]
MLKKFTFISLIVIINLYPILCLDHLNWDYLKYQDIFFKIKQLESRYYTSKYDCESKGLCPEYFPLCSDLSQFENTRKIPVLKPSTMKKYGPEIELLQVQTIIRHGARTPTRLHKCWEGMSQSWNCDDLVATVQASAHDLYNKTKTLEFSKHYDIRQSENNLNGTCQMGQLLLEGYLQQRINGQLIANAYFPTNSKESLVVGKPLELERNLKLRNNPDFSKEIFVRSSDMQRTTLSAAALITSLIEQVVGENETFDLYQRFPLHMMDMQSDYLFANANAENITEDLRSALHSKEYYDQIVKHQSLYKELALLVKTPHLEDLWPGDIMDCIMTSICTGNSNRLPLGFLQDNLLNRTIHAIEEELATIYSWDNSKLSKSEMARLLHDIRDYLIKAIIDHEIKRDNTEYLRNKCKKLYVDNNSIEYMLGVICDELDSLKIYPEKKTWVPKFILWSGHDTTIIPTMAAIKVWDKKWPPYASSFIIELYRGSQNETLNIDPDIYTDEYHHGNKESYQLDKNLPYFMRLLYNGKVITHNLNGCQYQELCPVPKFFKETNFVNQINNRLVKSASEGLNSTDLSLGNLSQIRQNNSEYKSIPLKTRLSTNFISSPNISVIWFLGGIITATIIFQIAKIIKKLVPFLNRNNSGATVDNYQAL